MFALPFPSQRINSLEFFPFVILASAEIKKTPGLRYSAFKRLFNPPAYAGRQWGEIHLDLWLKTLTPPKGGLSLLQEVHHRFGANE